MSPSPRKPMTGEQLDRALIKLYDNTEIGSSPRARSIAFAETLGCQDRTVRKWVAGEAEVPRHIAMLVNLMLSTNTSPEELRA